MSTLVLSLLLVLLIAIGLMMGRRVREAFVSGAEPIIKVSPAMANLLEPPTRPPPPVQVDTLKREQEIRCPDMSKYIRMDEIPCWNCSLP
jgi:hypothetical protein